MPGVEKPAWARVRPDSGSFLCTPFGYEPNACRPEKLETGLQGSRDAVTFFADSACLDAAKIISLGPASTERTSLPQTRPAGPDCIRQAGVSRLGLSGTSTRNRRIGQIER